MKNKKLTLLLFFSILFLQCISAKGEECLYGITKMLEVSSLPKMDENVRIKYEGSIDKKGSNADWDWWLYQDNNGEWVIFDVEGPGCIYNFVQHRYLSSEEPVFRFYFDGQQEPAITISLSEFGEKYPFVEPLSSRYIGPVDNGRGPIRVVRSFVPLAFRKACKITSSIKLEGPDRSKGEGGWGHVVYHSYTSPANISTYTGNENYYDLIHLWKRQGSNPNPQEKIDNQSLCNKTILPNDTTVLFRSEEKGAVNAIRLKISDMKPEYLQNVWIRMSWDENKNPDVYCPIGSFFGNSIGYNDTNYLLMGSTVDGNFYNYFPMPFWKNAVITLENKTADEINVALSEISVSANNYDLSECGYFRSTPYYERKHTLGADSNIGNIIGTGKLVASHITCYGERPNIITCEGDVRVHIDGIKTPQVESDGSESYVCYGWGFPTPAETHPVGGYDGLRDNPWSMTRLCIGDSYPFYKELNFGIESGESNNQYLEHLGTLFYYGRNNASLIETDNLDLGSKKSIRLHKYKALGNVKSEVLESYFEGDNDHMAVKGNVMHFNEKSSFVVKINPQNKGVTLRKRSNQSVGRQCAKILIDGEEVVERNWYFADRNPHKCWLEDEFEIPAKYTSGKSEIRITIIPIPVDDTNEPTWNESSYQVFSHISTEMNNKQ